MVSAATARGREAQRDRVIPPIQVQSESLVSCIGPRVCPPRLSLGTFFYTVSSKAETENKDQKGPLDAAPTKDKKRRGQKRSISRDDEEEAWKQRRADKRKLIVGS